MKKLVLLLCMIVPTVYASEIEDIVRAYNRPEGGYVLLDSNDELVGFSTEGILTKDNSAEILSLLSCSGYDLVIEEAESSKAVLSDYVMSDSVGPLLGEIAFNQGYPYNMYAPTVGGKNCVTGCVATAMAQIMAYWKYPSQCKGGQYEYVTSTLNKTMKIDFDTVAFNWKNIVPNYGAKESSNEEKSEVAKLMYACGVAVNMNYNTSGSGTQSEYVPNALVKYFDFKSGIILESMDAIGNDVEFIKALIDEIDAKHPMYCSASAQDPRFASYDGGHAFVIDGYGWVSATGRQKWNEEQKMETQPFIHFNWGWGGTDQIGNRNLWYRITGDKARAPYSNFKIIRGIVPADYTDDIQIEQSRPTDGKIYDILGREVKETVKGNVYIMNGHKFFAR